MDEKRKTTHIRAYVDNMKTFYDHLNSENKTSSDIIAWLLKIEHETRELRQSYEAQERERIGLEMLESQV